MTKDDILPFVKKNPISVGCGLLSIALAAGIYVRSGELPAATEEFDQKTAEASRLSANVQNAAQLKEQLDALTAAGKEVDLRLVHASQTLPNYQLFYKLESESGVKMTSGPTQGTPPKATGKSAFIAVPFSVTLQGTLAQLLDYLRRLESGSRYCRVLGTTLTVPITDRNSPMTLSLNIELLGVP
jgi:hypothetical protein